VSLLVVGSVALDSVKTPFGKIEDGLGGSATYFSIAAGCFTKVRLVAVVGEDFPERHVAFLRSRGVDLRGLVRAKGKTFRWKGSYGEDMNEAKTLKTELNVFETFRPELPTAYKDTGFVFLANIDPDLQRGVVDQIPDPYLVACDTMNYWISSKPRALKETLSRVDILFLNEGEARQLAGGSNLLKAARHLLSLGPTTVVIKRGEYGAFLFQKDNMFWAPAYPLETVRDPTGAGDSFAGGFMGYLSRRKSVTEARLRKALIYGSIMASFNVEAFSLNRLRRIKPADVEQRFRAFRALVRF
jgi:sugar/nucleoside kinase (ribokinase family)